MYSQNRVGRFGIKVLFSICFLLVIWGVNCYAQTDNQANVGNQPAATGSEQGGKVLDFVVINKVTKEPLPHTKLSIRNFQASGDERRDEKETDENGKCKIDVGQVRPTVFRVEASKDGFVPTRVNWGQSSSVQEVPKEYTLALEPGTSIGGIIQDEEGKPIEGVSVYLLVPGGDALERIAIGDLIEKTDPNGHWQCDIMPSNLPEIWIRLAHPDYSSDDMYGQTPQPPMEKLRDMTGIMVLKSGLLVKGKVLDMDGNPIRGATVAQGSDRFGSHYPDTRTDANGVFTFKNAKPGEMVLTVQTFGHAPDLKQISVSKGMAPIEFKLERGYTIKGRIVDVNGNPVAGAFVAADTWRGHRSLSWRVDTNADGKFQWRAAPSDEVLFDMGKMNYMSVRHKGMSPSDEEYEITMYPELKVHGTVVDANTGQAIPSFRLLSGIDWGNDQPTYWQRDSAKTFKDGRYEVTFSEPRNGHLVRIEAEGYKPGISRALLDNEVNVAFDFKLEKGTGPSGIVKLSDGKLAEGAEVILCTPGQSLNLQNGRMVQRRDNQFVEIKGDGKFSFPPQNDNFILVILHENGFLQISGDELSSKSEVTLKPWSKVDGKLFIGKEPGKNKEVLLMYDRSPEQNGINYYSNYQTVTDENGKFAFERVIPGKARIGRQVRLTEHSYTYSHCKPVEIEPGKTLDVTIGGTGRAVKGKVHIPDYAKGKIDIQEFSAHLNISSPNNPYTQMSLKVESDGRFSIDDVPTGSYTLTAYAYGPPQDPRMPFGDRVGMVTKAFMIPEMPGGRSDEPLDLGVIELEIPNKEAYTPSLIGKTLPDMNNFNINIKQADMENKPILICFWDLEQRPSRNSVQQLNRMNEELKEKGIAVIIIHASVADKDSLDNWIKEYNISLSSGMIKENSSTELGTGEEQTKFNWGVKALPWLILTDKDHIVKDEGFSIAELKDKI